MSAAGYMDGSAYWIAHNTMHGVSAPSVMRSEKTYNWWAGGLAARQTLDQRRFNVGPASATLAQH